MEKKQLKGQCLCGAVKISANVDTKLGVCHCSMCRAWVGGPFFAVDAGKDVTFEDLSNIGEYESSEWASRGFCKSCGSALYYFLKANGQYILSAGLFGDNNEFVFDHQIFVDEKPPYYHFANHTKMMTGEEVLAAFNANQ
ncbi:GFA family protein [Aliiglaciecola sp. CAU 1673]|uniref:GFA family protein n=1 Tax=Aliiglaciecola sp. CAU 1673 TaxID=3032595 RepID=UPI0023DAFE57|nr:GFA family protein [Aliiglaciecola sp. CAU 1673]MDF2180000.1 GFA family protein [Aliiglaciecola sp. CAU 1673]